MLVSRRAVLGLPAVLLAASCRDETPKVQASAAPLARNVALLVPGQATSDGAGVRLSRTLGSRLLPLLDPFLMLDQIRSEKADEYLRGFPDHPHRGFETVTYMIEGAMEHKDSVGNHGRLVSGSVQWMTAGRGIIHSEMPKQDRGLLFGFQLWVNLPARLKMTKPRYQDIAPSAVPEVSHRGARVRVVAGNLDAQQGAVEGIAVGANMLDVTLAAGENFEHEIPASHNAFVQVLHGDVAVGGERSSVGPGTLAVLDAGQGFSARGGSEGGRFLLLSGEPIGEPVARRGPFVMNTEAELTQAFADYRSGKLTSG